MVLRWTAVLLLVLLMLLIAELLIVRSRYRHRIIETQPSLAPGSLIPESARLICGSPPYCTGVRSCLVRGTEARIDYYTDSPYIQSVAYRPGGLTVGDLILAWGEPIGESGGTYCQFVYWAGGRGAYLCSPYSPFAEVRFIEFVDPSRNSRMKKWRGWRSE